MPIYADILTARQSGKKMISVLVDPDKIKLKYLEDIVHKAMAVDVDYFLVGGSLVLDDRLDMTLEIIRNNSDIPIILFPGNANQVHPSADALFFLSLISGRNPELLIGQHVIAAPYIRQCGIEPIATGYMLVDGGRPTTVSYISHTQPIPHDKEDIAACTAMAGEMLGLKTIYMDAGSGAIRPVSARMIARVREYVQLPIIVGGGIRTAEQALEAAQAGADMIVIGNAIESSPDLVIEFAEAIHSSSLKPF